MSVFKCNFYSKCLKNFVDVSVYIPSMHNGEALFYPLEEVHKKQQYPAVYLLHGMLDDHSSWLRWSTAEEIAEQHKLALIMPSGQNGFYINAVHGLPYYDFISKELPMWAEANLPVLAGRENRFIAGLSMGGYGALRHGLSNPDRYAAIGAFSAAADIIGLNAVLEANGMGGMVDYDSLFSGIDSIQGTDNDLYALMHKCKEQAAQLPHIYMGCGTEDPIVYNEQLAFSKALAEAGFSVRYSDMAGQHEWKVWTQCFREFVDMIDTLRSDD